ncbi:methyltransferase family protein [Mycobacterium heckeshornense]|uniref:Uncharacterized protein n=1 Tax=Mycobacterium heckeshornense TaxID=110505 RepID=A0A2I3EGG1_9MYCO|nr:isoprenylcysteine carboxylmethyltransferase family protein [Mycobacterium heckeshornense]KMV19420.1 membrane protein [Mycobacterium heckeshornense]MCV7035961.1 isoprenylcysteine carboxylmethyltransferase family protein [Mycobacterium heckeshornense]BCO33699.1 hypothetical protein MHEC_01320 [Mycobacterium heckeshornense]BCQ06732.1 hypothetical protein JMUB5695_00141 [Mycobacterium heckeshornense]
MKPVLRVLVLAFVEPVVFGLVVFLVAGTASYWQGWAFLGVYTFSTWLPGIYLLKTNPVALQRRMRGGPMVETRVVQKAVMAGLWLSLAAMLAVSALDHRFGWAVVPAALSLVGDGLVAGGLSVAALVIVQNSYATATVQVERDQKLVSTGLYRLVRHPMYTGTAIMMVGIPLALGSYWGLICVVPGLIVLALRIRDEEKLLQKDLDGYSGYAQKVRYRLVPCIW